MNIIRLIEKKRDKGILSKEEINWMIDNYVDGNIKDYQMSSMLMAIVLNGMNENECADLTMAMVNSGDTIDLSDIKGTKCDKHSTGGVGDKTTLVLAPLVASCGVPIAKMSGRGLGHTGGTIDKIESIPNAKTTIDINDFINQVNRIGVAVAGQTANLAPADKLLYALRDVTGTVESIPLIASSIMSKKIASGADAIVLDVKIGNGAFMKNLDDARALAHTMVKIGNNVGRKTIAIITGMEEPLGMAVGNTVEVIESIETLKGNGPKDLNDLVLELGSQMLIASGKIDDFEEGKKLLQNNINNGKGLLKFQEFVKAQDGDIKIIDDYSVFKQPKYKKELISDKAGYVAKIVAHDIGLCAMELGAGRKSKEDNIDFSAGIILNKKIGDEVKVGEVLLTYYSDIEVDDIEKVMLKSFEISDTKVEQPKLVYEIIE